jgi:hypothetical protein
MCDFVRRNIFWKTFHVSVLTAKKTYCIYITEIIPEVTLDMRSLFVLRIEEPVTNKPVGRNAMSRNIKVSSIHICLYPIKN